MTLLEAFALSGVVGVVAVLGWAFIRGFLSAKPRR